jgi:hypothetical protein
VGDGEAVGVIEEVAVIVADVDTVSVVEVVETA